MRIGSCPTLLRGDNMSQNLFNINAYNTGWIYQPKSGSGVEKAHASFFGQSNVIPVTPGDLVNIYGATNNLDFFFVTTHGSFDINKPVASTKMIPFRSANGLSFVQYIVPRNVYFISMAFINSNAPNFRIYLGQKTEFGHSVVVSCLGDSITQGYISPNVWANPTYPEIVANRLNCIVCNYGVAATGICNGSSESFSARLKKMAEPWVDCLVIFGGTNDYGDGLAKSLGKITDKPAQGTNFYASFKYLVENAMNKYPMSQILIVTPLRRSNSEANKYGISMEDIVKAEKNVAQSYGVRCFDAYHSGGFNPFIAAQRMKYTSDGLHPNQEGINRFVGPMLAAEIERLIKYRG